MFVKTSRALINHRISFSVKSVEAFTAKDKTSVQKKRRESGDRVLPWQRVVSDVLGLGGCRYPTRSTVGRNFRHVPFVVMTIRDEFIDTASSVTWSHTRTVYFCLIKGIISWHWLWDRGSYFLQEEAKVVAGRWEEISLSHPHTRVHLFS